MKKTPKIKQRDFIKLAAIRGEINLSTKSVSLDEKNFKYNRKIKHKNKEF